jgi:hypothetical protein
VGDVGDEGMGSVFRVRRCVCACVGGGDITVHTAGEVVGAEDKISKAERRRMPGANYVVQVSVLPQRLGLISC